jgi:hypothetical protein
MHSAHFSVPEPEAHEVFFNGIPCSTPHSILFSAIDAPPVVDGAHHTRLAASHPLRMDGRSLGFSASVSFDVQLPREPPEMTTQMRAVMQDVAATDRSQEERNETASKSGRATPDAR